MEEGVEAGFVGVEAGLVGVEVVVVGEAGDEGDDDVALPEEDVEVEPDVASCMAAVMSKKSPAVVGGIYAHCGIVVIDGMS